MERILFPHYSLRCIFTLLNLKNNELVRVLDQTVIHVAKVPIIRKIKCRSDQDPNTEHVLVSYNCYKMAIEIV